MNRDIVLRPTPNLAAKASNEPVDFLLIKSCNRLTWLLWSCIFIAQLFKSDEIRKTDCRRLMQAPSREGVTNASHYKRAMRSFWQKCRGICSFWIRVLFKFNKVRTKVSNNDGLM